jgi:bacterioferritin
MKGNAQVLDQLNKILANELVAINQYFLHARVLKSWGFEALGKKMYAESIEEMKHADACIERILFLDGMPTISESTKPTIGKTVHAMFESDLALEEIATRDLRTAIACTEQAQDYQTRQFLSAILADEEEHIDWLEMQLQLLEKLGEKNYLQSQL